MASAVKKLVCMPTQCYDTPSGKVGKRFMGILSVELDDVRDRKLNAERVIIFQSVILQHAQGVNNSTQIRKRILFQLDLWNSGFFDEIVKDTYNYAMGYIGKFHGTQTMEKRHQTFSNLVVKGKLCGVVRSVCEREKEVVLQPNKLTENCTGTINKTVASVLEGRHPCKKFSPVLR